MRAPILSASILLACLASPRPAAAYVDQPIGAVRDVTADCAAGGTCVDAVCCSTECNVADPTRCTACSATPRTWSAPSSPAPSAPNRAHPYVLGIEEQASGSPIGHVGFSPARGSVEIGYAVEQRLHGRGLATEAVTAASGWVLAALGLPELLGIVAADNVGSCRVLEKAGFVPSGEEGFPRNILVYRRVPTTRAARP